MISQKKNLLNLIEAKIEKRKFDVFEINIVNH